MMLALTGQVSIALLTYLRAINVFATTTFKQGHKFRQRYTNDISDAY